MTAAPSVATSDRTADAGAVGRGIGDRLAAAGIALPRAECVVADFASDPPLSRSLAEAARVEAARVVEGVGAAMLATRAKRGVIAVRHAASHKAVRSALAAASATSVRAARVEDVWPTVGLDRDLGSGYTLVLDGERLLDVEAAALGRARVPRRVTVAGAVARPGVIALPPADAASQHADLALQRDAALQQESVADGSHAGHPTVASLVAAAGGATAPYDAWVAFDGGAYGGVMADREEPARSSLLLVLPARHPLVARARLTTSERLRRAASTCEGCRACTDWCPAHLDGGALSPHRIVAALATGAEGLASAAAFAVDCTGCGLCDAACPAGVAPAALVADLGARLKRATPTQPASPVAAFSRPDAHPDRAGRRASIALLLLRAGLAEYAATS